MAHYDLKLNSTHHTFTTVSTSAECASVLFFKLVHLYQRLSLSVVKALLTDSFSILQWNP